MVGHMRLTYENGHVRVKLSCQGNYTPSEIRVISRVTCESQSDQTVSLNAAIESLLIWEENKQKTNDKFLRGKKVLIEYPCKKSHELERVSQSALRIIVSTEFTL